MYSTRYPCQILIKREFSDIFSKNTEIWTFMKIRPVKAKLLNADGRTDMTNLIVAFRKPTNAPQNRNSTFLKIWTGSG